MARFTGQTIFITGGTSGIGLATAKRLLWEGATVLASGSRQESLDRAAAELPGAHLFINDSGDPAAAADLADVVRGHGGRLDAAFLNAGFGRFAPVAEVTAEEFDSHFNVLVKGPLLEARARQPVMNDGGAILITTSVVNLMGLPAASIYSSA